MQIVTRRVIESLYQTGGTRASRTNLLLEQLNDFTLENPEVIIESIVFEDDPQYDCTHMKANLVN